MTKTTRVLNVFFVLHLLLESFAACMFFYFVISGNVSLAKGTLFPSEFLNGINLAHPTYLLLFSVWAFLLVGTLFPVAFALRSPAGSPMRTVAVLVCICYHAGVSLGGMLLLPQVAFAKTGMLWMANPHLYMGLFFITMLFIAPRNQEQSIAASNPS